MKFSRTMQHVPGAGALAQLQLCFPLPSSDGYLLAKLPNSMVFRSPLNFPEGLDVGMGSAVSFTLSVEFAGPQPLNLGEQKPCVGGPAPSDRIDSPT